MQNLIAKIEMASTDWLDGYDNLIHAVALVTSQ